MRRNSSRLRSISIFALLAFWSAALVPAAASADPMSIAAPSIGVGPATATTPSTPAAARQPIELREILWSRYGEVRHARFPFQGDKPLNGVALYQAMGRDDLVQAYESRTDAKIAFAIASLAAMVAGTVVLTGATPDTECDALSKNPTNFQSPLCRTDWKTDQIATGIVLTLLGPVLLGIAGLGITADPLSPAERQKLIETYNASLVRPAADSAPAVPRPAALRFTAAPSLSSTGAAVTVGGGF